MKLRQIKHRHVKRLRRRIVMARMASLRIEWDRAADEMSDALVKAILAPGEAIKQSLMLIFNRAGALVAHATPE